MFEDINGITSGVYNESSATNIPLRLRADQDTVNVTVCRLNTSSCYSVITGLFFNHKSIKYTILCSYIY